MRIFSISLAIEIAEIFGRWGNQKAPCHSFNLQYEKDFLVEKLVIKGTDM